MSPASTRTRVGLAALAVAPVLALAVLFVLPVLGVLARGLVEGGSLDVRGVGEVLARGRVHDVVAFTLVSAGWSTSVATALGLPLAHVLYRLDVPGRRAWRALVTVPFVLPTVVVGVAFRHLLADSGPAGFLGLDQTATAVVAALVFFNVSVVVRTVGTFAEGLDRRPADAATALGASPGHAWRTVVLPTLLPAVAAAAAVVFLFSATAFGVVLTLGGLQHANVETEIWISATQFGDLTTASVLALLQVLMVVGLLVVTGRGRRRTGAGEAARVGATAALRGPGRADVPALVASVVTVVLLTVPLATSVAGSLRADGRWTLAHYRDLLAGSADRVPLAQALSLSLRIAVDATLVALVLGVSVAVLVTRRPTSPAAGRVVTVTDGVFLLPLGVSAVVVGLGYLVTLDQPPLDLRSSVVLVPLAQAVVALPLVVRTLTPSLHGVSDAQRQAAASLGASPWQVFRDVEAPVLVRPLLGATGLAFAVSLGEFGATSFLAGPGSPTLPVLVYDLISRPGADNLGAALAGAVVLGLVTAVVMVVAERLHWRAVGTW